MMKRVMIIAVIGGEEASAEVARLAEEVGRELARRGCTIICGGGSGVMEAACRGARAEGGHTIGILPGHDRRQANRYVEFVIVTGLGEARNVIVVKSAHAVIAVDGGFGTLAEIALALQQGTRVVGLDTWLLSYKGRAETAIVLAESVVDAVEKAVSSGAGRPDGDHETEQGLSQSL